MVGMLLLLLLPMFCYSPGKSWRIVTQETLLPAHRGGEYVASC